MTRIVLFSDTHLGFDMPSRRQPGPHHRGPDFQRNFNTVVNHAISSRADLLIHAGDLFHRSDVHPNLVDEAYGTLFECAQSMPVILIPGNHERSTFPQSLLLGHPDLHVFWEPSLHCLELGNLTIEIAGLPFARNIRQSFRNLLPALPEKPQDTFRLLCMHQTVAGARAGHYTFRTGDDVIPTRDLPDHFDLIVSGHIHRHQKLNTKTPVLYCGSTERTSFAEREEVKGFCEITIDADHQFTTTFVPLPTRPMMDFEFSGSDLDRQFAALLAVAKDWHPSSIVRLRQRDRSTETPPITMKQLRQVLPNSMAIQTGSLFRADRS